MVNHFLHNMLFSLVVKPDADQFFCADPGGGDQRTEGVRGRRRSPDLHVGERPEPPEG